MNTQMLESLSEAQRFLDALGGRGHHFRTIPEAPNEKGRTRKYQTFNHIAIDRDNCAGSGVFAAVNEGGDTDNSISAIRAVFLDIDRKSFGSLNECEQAIRYAHEGRRDKDEPIAEDWPHASMIVRSGGGGAHLYWLVEDCLVERFKPVQQALARRFNGDPAVCNPSRIMRLPGTVHWKSGARVPVLLSLCDPKRRYKLDNLLERLGIAPEPTASPNSDAVAAFKSMPQTPHRVAALRDALARLDKRDPEAVNDRETWLRVLMSICAHDWGEEGRKIAADWSAQSPKFDEDRFAVDWRGIKPEGGITAKYIYDLAIRGDCPDVASDDGMACRFAIWLDGRAMYARGQFHIWTGSYWRPDRTAIERLLKDYADENARLALEHFLTDPQSNTAKFLDKVAKSLLSVKRQHDVLKSLRVLLAVRDDQIDADPMLLAVPNGIVDLDKGKLMATDPLAYCTRCAGVPYDDSMQCPRWLAFLNQIFSGDAEVIAFIQRWMGYCLTGSMVEEKLLFAYGIGANGKSVIANVQQYIMSSYAVTADPSLLMSSRRTAGSASPELIRLAGARLCLLNESKAGDRMDDGCVKKLVSTEKMVARGLYKDEFEFHPTAKLFFRSNHRPVVRDDTDGFWRRPMLVAFAVQIPHAQQDPDLFEKLKAEAPAILAWAVQGCLDWKRMRLSPPKSVTEATDSYRSDSDAIGDWLATRTEGGGATSTAALLDDFVRFAGLPRPPSPKAFAAMLKDRGVAKHDTSKSRGFGITLKPPPPTDADDMC